MVNIDKILDRLKFGSADGPRVRDGRSAVHEKCSPEALQKGCQPEFYSGGRSTNGQRMVRGSPVHPVRIGYTEGASSEQGADGSSWNRGQSASVGKSSPEAVLVGCLIKFFLRRTVRQSRADSPRLDRKVRSGCLTYMGCPFLFPPTNPHQTSKRLSLFLSSTWGRRQGQGFLRGSRTVRAHPWTLLNIQHHILSVFH